MRRQAAQGLLPGRHRLQGVRLLPDRQPRQPEEFRARGRIGERVVGQQEGRLRNLVRRQVLRQRRQEVRGEGQLLVVFVLFVVFFFLILLVGLEGRLTCRGRGSGQHRRHRRLRAV